MKDKERFIYRVMKKKEWDDFKKKKGFMEMLLILNLDSFIYQQSLKLKTQ